MSHDTADVPPDDLGELLSALLDGELTPDEETRVERFIADSPAVQEELAAVAAVRSLVRDLPAVDPPFGFYERMLRPAGSARGRRHTGIKVISAVAVAAAAFVLVIGVTPVADSVVPPVAAFADRHVQMDPTTAASGAGPQTADPASGDFTPVPADELDDMGAPAELAGQFHRVSGYQSGGTRTVHLVYSDGHVMVSVYEQAGLVSWDRLSGGTMVDLDGEPAWTSERDQEAVMVVERGPVVYTVIAQKSSASQDEMTALAGALPTAEDPSLVDRAGNGCRSVATQFSLGLSGS